MNREDANLIVNDLLDDLESTLEYPPIYEQISLIDDDITILIANIMDWPGNGIYGSVTGNVHTINFQTGRHEFVSGARYNKKTDVDLALLTTYLLQHENGPFQGCLIPDLRADGGDKYLHGYLTLPFPWKQLMEINSKVGFPFFYYLLPVSQEEADMLIDHGYDAMEELLSIFRQDVFDLGHPVDIG